ncbi:MAG TPA: TolC family protein [Pseudomonadales bacterium]|nr:TolC family protein [Pseudomonadales bacterium]
MPSKKTALSLALCAALAGCASVQPEKGKDSLDQVAQQQAATVLVWQDDSEAQQKIDQVIHESLAAPLSLQQAVKIALLNNPGLRAELQKIGVAQADLASASAIGNPLFSAARLTSADTTQLSMSLEFNFLNLILLPQRKRIAEYEFEQSRLEVAQQILDLSYQVKQAWYEAVAQAQQEELMQTVMQATEAASRLAYKQLMAGTGTKREQARKQLFFNKAKQAWLLAKADNYAAKEKLNRLLGFRDDAAALNLPGHLPELPAQRPDVADLTQQTLKNRFDIEAARQKVTQYQKELGIARSEVLLSDTSVGAEVEKSTGEATTKGPALSIGVPISDTGSAAKYRTQALLRQSEFALAATQSNALSEARAAQAVLQARYDVAQRQQQVVLPLNNSILVETQLRYNGMLSGVYDLLEDRQNEVEAASEYITMLKEFWLADAELNHVMGGVSHATVK